ncbi:cupin domain-containing protein [Teichococcus deserti]|uniref:cupin domain-containing protein n=1 Tax=Teichococcus deserti TaxID=1817963 RepID=UPI001A9589C6|nr:cupin domain-containing protein [Pseudoroseomonas deserti]
MTIRTADLGAGVQKSAPADRLIEGNPEITVWDQDASHGGRVRSGVADLGVGTTRSMKGGDCEVVHIISGVAELTEEGGETRTFRAGDSFVMKPGFTGVWKTVETVRKVFTVISGA